MAVNPIPRASIEGKPRFRITKVVENKGCWSDKNISCRRFLFSSEKMTKNIDEGASTAVDSPRKRISSQKKVFRIKCEKS